MEDKDRTMEEWKDQFRLGGDESEEAMEVFGESGEEGVQALTSLMDIDELPLHRAIAASVLWSLGRRAKSAQPKLEDSLVTDDDVVVQMRCAQALLSIEGRGHDAAISFLMKLRERDDVDQWISESAKEILRTGAGIRD